MAAAAATEAKRVTGRDINFDFEGSDVQIAREHAEGVLRGLERFPGAQLAEVRVTEATALAYSVPSKFNPNTGKALGPIDSIHFSRQWSSNPSAYQQRLSETSGVFKTPTAVALHEFGHVVAANSGGEARAGRLARSEAKTAGVPVKRHISSQISRYATTNSAELAAEAFADVMVNGSSASDLSQKIFRDIG